ncbi:PPE family protein [Mycobacterium simiae]|uniref:PPE family protein n=1 Tax=Mycobacterium simiae TaxID=1784 RepID=A0A5B1BSP3_MYCSI|nr:PPE family protein [Mycobacterium simiae]KAA1250745.1 PPE family protein [Mycobacterium simiae]
MTAPIWIASPPEVHSALLSSGPGPGPLLASAEAWESLSTAYAEAANELTALLGAVHAGAWDGPSAEAYVAAHAPYLAWLTQAITDNAAMAAQQEIAAAAYLTALAAMPTLPELAVNHATHAALVATNFFGINTIPIALNEADYARMWIQAATVMSSYQAVADSAVAAAPPAEAAPAIWFTELQSFLEGLVPKVPYPNTDDYPLYQEILAFFNKIGFTEVTDPFEDFFSGLNGSSVLPPIGVPGSWLAFTGNPLSYLNPLSIAYVLAVPLDPGSYVAFTSIVIIDDLLAILYTAVFNPQALVFVVPLATVEIIGSTIGNTIQLLHYLVQQTVALIPVILPLLSAAAVPLAAAGGLAPGLAGLAGLAALPGATPVAPLAAPPFGAALAPGLSTSTLTLSPPQVTAAPPPASPPTPPAAATPPLGVPPGPVGTGMEAFAYLVGGLDLDARRAASTRSTKSTALNDTVVPESAPVADKATQARRSRRQKLTQPGRGYEYMDLEAETDDEPELDGRADASTVSNEGAGRLGFAGTAGKSASEPAGLSTVAGDAFGGGPTMPLMPGTWGVDRS